LQLPSPEDRLLQLIIHAASQQSRPQGTVVQGLAQGGRVGALQHEVRKYASGVLQIILLPTDHCFFNLGQGGRIGALKNRVYMYASNKFNKKSSAHNH